MQVSIFFTESPTNPFLRCVDIERVSKLCHDKGALVCVDGTFATPMNQKALALGADLVVHSATKYIAGHNDVCQCFISHSLHASITLRLQTLYASLLTSNTLYRSLQGQSVVLKNWSLLFVTCIMYLAVLLIL